MIFFILNYNYRVFNSRLINLFLLDFLKLSIRPDIIQIFILIKSIFIFFLDRLNKLRANKVIFKYTRNKKKIEFRLKVLVSFSPF